MEWKIVKRPLLHNRGQNVNIIFCHVVKIGLKMTDQKRTKKIISFPFRALILFWVVGGNLRKNKSFDKNGHVRRYHLITNRKRFFKKDSFCGDDFDLWRKLSQCNLMYTFNLFLLAIARAA